MVKPIRLWLSPPGPNSWKVALILEELEIPYEINAFKFDDAKKKPFIDINPNGRVPAIEDPNTNLTLWESGAIIQYLVEQYDKDKKLTFDTLVEKNLLNQYLMFQVSGQGPYYGQAGWFNGLHPENVPSAFERYKNEIKRVLGVLDGILEGKQWLVGNKCTFADLAFSPWNHVIDGLLELPEGEDKFEGFPNVKAWHERILSRSSWKKVIETRLRILEEQGFGPNGLPKGIDTMEEYREMMKAYQAATA